MSPGAWKSLAVVLLITRLVEGSIWFGGFISKRPDNDFAWFPEWVMKESEYSPIPPYKWFLDTIVIPHITFWGWVQFLTEMFLAITLILGIFVGITGLIATLWALNIAIGSVFVPGEILYNLQYFVLVPLILALTRSGRVYGLDAWLRPRLLASKNKWVRRAAEWGT